MSDVKGGSYVEKSDLCVICKDLCCNGEREYDTANLRYCKPLTDAEALVRFLASGPLQRYGTAAPLLPVVSYRSSLRVLLPSVLTHYSPAQQTSTISLYDRYLPTYLFACTSATLELSATASLSLHRHSHVPNMTTSRIVALAKRVRGQHHQARRVLGKERLAETFVRCRCPAQVPAAA